MEFVPEQPKDVQEVPYFDDVRADEGWQGHTTSKSLERLKSEVMRAIERLGGVVIGFQRGTFIVGGMERDGFQIHYAVEQPGGLMLRGKIDVAALPVRKDHRRRRSYEQRRMKSLKMALYMLRMALDGTRFLRDLSPGYAPLMPWMLEEASGKTIAQLWSERVTVGQLLPPGGADFIEGDFRDMQEEER